ncbi:MAG: hypothetical protein ACYC9O_10635 [Candidatus Latescibacterota bacterium]
MKEKYHLKRLIGGAAWLGLATVLFAQMSFGQGFISREYRPRWQQEYENFGGYDLRKSPTYLQQQYQTGSRTQTMGVLSRVTYDPFGNFLLPGGNVYNMSWDRSRIGTSYSFDGTYSNNVFNNLMISADEFSNWQTKFMIGNVTGNGQGLRVYFTPSTLKITNFNGIRWDLSSRKNNVSLIAENQNGPAATNLYGVHWQSILGDILKVGGTYVTRQRGTVPYAHTDIDNGSQGMRDEPRYMYLVLTDDSPEDFDTGARIYDVKVMVNGADVTGQVPMRVMKIPDIMSRKRYYGDGFKMENFQKQYIFEKTSGGSGFFPRRVEDNLATTESWFLNIMGATNPPSQMYNDIFAKSTDAGNYGQINLPDMSKIDDPSGRYWAADTSLGYQEANGTDVVIYEFLVPHGTRDLKFQVLAANDYNIDIIAALYRYTQGGEAAWESQPLTAAYKGLWSVFYDAKNATKANGNVKDGSNVKWVTVEYDRISGMNVYGLNMELNWRGLYIKGEFNEYNSLRSYPLNETLSGGAENQWRSRAWFLNLEKDFGGWSFGGELYNYPREYMRYLSPVEDNDDDDNYPETTYTGAGGGDPQVTPGMDIDWDRDMDNAQNGARFLEYYFDDVVFGDDFDHNGTIDARYNDSAPDYPYERNSMGQHFFVKMKPRERTLITAGYYDIKQESREGRNQTEYAKFEHFQPLGSLGEFSVQHRTELIKYNYFETNRAGAAGSYTLPVLVDNWNNTTLLHTRLKPIQNLNVINDVLARLNKGLGPEYTSAPFTINEHLMKQTPIKQNRRSTGLMFVHKADYMFTVADRQIIPDVYIGGYRIMKAKRIKEMTFQPMLKYENNFSTVYNVRLGKYYQHRTYRMYPIIRFDYQVAPNTKFRVGFQGIPGFEEIYRVGNVKTYYEYELDEYNRRQMVLAFENRTLYQGFNLVVLIGMRKDKRTYVERMGRQLPGFTEYFFTIQSEAQR